MEREQKKIFRNNVIKCIIGTILLLFSYGYIQNHPAERASIFSGFEIMWQRVTVYVAQLTKTNSEELKKKYDYEKTYDELIQMAQSKSCVNPNVLTELQETYLKLKKEPIKNLDVALPGYQRQAVQYKTMIDNCTQ
ncbi:MAG: hypothetical protein WCJ39_04490 [bacterium]